MSAGGTQSATETQCEEVGAETVPKCVPECPAAELVWGQIHLSPQRPVLCDPLPTAADAGRPQPIPQRQLKRMQYDIIFFKQT